jgi:hypothetical protein
MVVLMPVMVVLMLVSIVIVPIAITEILPVVALPFFVAVFLLPADFLLATKFCLPELFAAALIPPVVAVTITKNNLKASVVADECLADLYWAG